MKQDVHFLVFVKAKPIYWIQHANNNIKVKIETLAHIYNKVGTGMRQMYFS